MQPNTRARRSPFTDDEFKALPPDKRRWWFRVFALMSQSGADLDIARAAVEAADNEHQAEQSGR
jgi:hypothetical protein